MLPVEGIDPTYQPDSQNRRSALHAAAQRGLLEICYMLIQVRRAAVPGVSSSPSGSVSEVMYAVTGWRQRGRQGQRNEDSSAGGRHQQPRGGGSLPGPERSVRLSRRECQDSNARFEADRFSRVFIIRRMTDTPAFTTQPRWGTWKSSTCFWRRGRWT